ncbi:MAG: type III ribulose-bisphosphate carboxylase [archaeon]
MADYEQFVDFSRMPGEHDVIASFRVKVPRWSSKKRAWGAVAAESSVGTWSPILNKHYATVEKVRAWVFEAKGEWIKIAYPEDHFEYGNIPQILASIAGNVFGMKAVDSLRLEDIQFTEKHVKAFPGPKFGREGIRQFMKVPKRPIMLSVAKPKVGMTTAEHTEVGREVWEGGLDLLKDDENLAGQDFNKFEDRVKSCIKLRDQIEKKTGEKKSYLINITAGTVREMEKRARIVRNYGNEFAMIDIITTGWAAIASMREICGDYKLALHAHRAMHGAMTRNKNHGFSMNCVAKCVRLLGVDTLHIGTANVGKLVGSEEETLHLRDQTTLEDVPAQDTLHMLPQKWYGTKPLFPCSSGGLHPLLVDKVMNKLGSNIMLQIGGGIHGHPQGSFAGAKAMREAVEAYLQGIDLAEAAKTSPELKIALEYWGRKGTR